ncbi:MAG TPA: transcriptional regulator [Mycobacteriales bacterium]|nr:transcriptional regulator [Mycobacteriales bacterium]
MDPTARILRLLSLLQTYRHWPGEELSDRLGVSPRTLRRDVDRLRELGYPVDTSRGTGGGYQLAAGTRIPPLLLDDDEAVAIAVGLRTATGGGVTGIEETSVQALAKLQQVLPPRLRRRVDALADATETTVFPRRGPTVPADVLVAVAQACRGQEQLRFAYAAADGTESARLVEPHRLVARGRRWYLVAWDLQRDAWRTFRVDRLARPFANGVRFTPRELPAEDAAAYVAQALRSVPQRHEALLAVPLPLAEATEQVPRWVGELAADGPDRSLLRVANDSAEWLALTLTMLEVEVTLLDASPEVREQLARLRTKVTRLAVGSPMSAS